MFYGTLAASLLPLTLAKVIPVFVPQHQFAFLGISYVTFRALDIVFCLRDNVIAAPSLFDFLGFLFFFPTISAGPIDRYRRFAGDWKKKRTRDEFIIDLDEAVHRIFRGFLYKFILAALIKKYWLDRVASEATFGALVSYICLQPLSVFRFRWLQRLCHRLQLPSRCSYARKFQPSLSGTQYSRFLEPLAYHPFLSVPRPRLHAFSARGHARWMDR